MAKQTVSNAQPNAKDVQAILNLLNAGKLAETEMAAKKLSHQFPNVFILHHALGIARAGLKKPALAVESYQQAIQLQPTMPDLYFNLAIALTECKEYAQAIQSYQQAIRLNPHFFEAYGNLGTVFQQQGQLDAAITHYQQGLAINPQDARGHFNCGTALRDHGQLALAVSSYERAIALFPHYADAHNNLGETLRDQGNMDGAVKCYQHTLKLNPHHANANYNMAEFLYLAGRLDEAVTFFETSQLDDWQARRLCCLYKAQHFDAFKTALDIVVKNTPHTSPFVATLAAHYAINFGIENPYNFCKNSFDFVYQKSLPELSESNSALLTALLNDIHHSDIAERKQGMLHLGTQSAGNLFKRPEASFNTLAALIKRAFIDYENSFAGADCALIKDFPTQSDFTSSWVVNMQKGGHLDPHIHEIGWISGAVYLAMPQPKNHPDEGAFEYGFHGDHYPQHHKNFPVGLVHPKVGDIVLFPSSLFHRTIPFNADAHRICIAFDLKPSAQFESSAQSAY